jgi:integrase
MDRQEPGPWLPSPGSAEPNAGRHCSETLRKVLDAAPSDFAAFLRLVAVTGMRRGEACALRRSDVDMGAGVIRKARAISQGVERDTKTGARYALALDAATIDVLATHLDAMDDRAAEFDITLKPDCFVFSNEPDCSRPWRPDGVTQRFARLCDRLGLEGLRLKDLRDCMVRRCLSLASPCARSRAERDTLGPRRPWRITRRGCRPRTAQPPTLSGSVGLMRLEPDPF